MTWAVYVEQFCDNDGFIVAIITVSEHTVQCSVQSVNSENGIFLENYQVVKNECKTNLIMPINVWKTYAKAHKNV